MASAPTHAPPGPGAAQGPNDESDDSSTVTRIFTFQDRLDEIHELRERKLILGGRLSRPVKPYRKEDVKMHPPRPGMWDDPEQAYYSMYLFLERKYWDGELRAWESLLSRIQHSWEMRNDVAGSNVPPLPPVRDMDPLKIHTEYLRLVHDKVEYGFIPSLKNPFSGGWHFGDYALLLEHSQAMEQLVEEMRKERGSTDQALTEEKDHGETHEATNLVSYPDGRMAKQLLGDDSQEDTTSQADHASRKTPSQEPVAAASRKRKRAGDNEPDEDATPRAGRAHEKTRQRQSRASAPKKQTMRGSRSGKKTSTSTAGTADVPEGAPIEDSSQVSKQEVQAKIMKKSEPGPKSCRARAPVSESLTGRLRRGIDISGLRTEGSRHSRRIAGLTAENGGI